MLEKMQTVNGKQLQSSDATLVIYQCDDKIHSMLICNDRLIKVTTFEANQICLNDIQIGRILQIVTNINAAFVRLDDNTKAFLPLAESQKVFVTSKNCFCDPKQGDDILVQVTMLADKGKEIRVSNKLSISGKYCVITFGKGSIGCSNKLNANEKSALISYVKDSCADILNKEYSVIIRTNANSLNSDEMHMLKDEIIMLKQKMQFIMQNSSHREYGIKVYQALVPYLQEIQSLKKDSYCKIVTDSTSIYSEIFDYLSQNQKEDLPKLVLYQDALISMQTLYGLQHKIELAMHKKVWLPSGGYLYIEPTQAMTVIDVNTGKYDKKTDKETAVFLVNKEAAEEIAYQLQLRNISGIVIIDFINMKSSDNNDKLLEYLRICLSKDRVICKIIDITALGLVEITRKKTDKTLNEQIFG